MCPASSPLRMSTFWKNQLLFGTHPDSCPPLLLRTHHPFLFSLGLLLPFLSKKPKGSTVPLPVVSPARVPGATAAVVSAAAARTTPGKGPRADEASDGWHVGDPPKSRHIPWPRGWDPETGDLDWEKKHLSKGWRCDLKNRKTNLFLEHIITYIYVYMNPCFCILTCNRQWVWLNSHLKGISMNGPFKIGANSPTSLGLF